MKYRPLALIITGVLLGFLTMNQSRSFQGVQDIYGRDSRANIFHEIQILKRTNENLKDEISDLESRLAKASDQEEVLKAIQDEIKKDSILAGRTNISGPGLEIDIKKDVSVIWLTDIVNELWSAGAEAVSVNGIRLTNSTTGFDTLPSGQISLNGVILSSPYVFNTIGDKKVLEEALTQRQGIVERLKESFPKIEVMLEKKDIIQMEKVL